MEKDAADARPAAHKKAMENFPLPLKALKNSKVHELTSRLTACLGVIHDRVRWNIHSRSCKSPIVSLSCMNPTIFFTSFIWTDVIIPKIWNRTGWDIPSENVREAGEEHARLCAHEAGRRTSGILVHGEQQESPRAPLAGSETGSVESVMAL